MQGSIWPHLNTEIWCLIFRSVLYPEILLKLKKMLSASEGKLGNSDRHGRKQTFTTTFKHSHLQHSGITAWSPSKATQPEALPPTNHQSFPQPRSGSGHCGSLPCRAGIWPSGKESLNSHPPALHLAYFQIKQVLAFCQVATYRGKEAAFPKR